MSFFLQDHNQVSSTPEHRENACIIMFRGVNLVNYNYREVIKTLNLTIMPSANVTKWDVLPSESSDKNFLVLDITNCSQYEMDLLYADSKNLVIEPCDVCRIPLPVDR